MSRRVGSRARLKSAKRRAKNPDVKKKKPAERSGGDGSSFDSRPKR